MSESEIYFVDISPEEVNDVQAKVQKELGYDILRACDGHQPDEVVATMTSLLAYFLEQYTYSGKTRHGLDLTIAHLVSITEIEQQEISH